MSRSGYDDCMSDNWALIKYRGQVASAIRGNRGQAFLRDLAAALDELPDKKLISKSLQHGDCVCAIGSVGVKRGVDMSKLDPDDIETVAAKFGIAHQLAREIVWENDECGPHDETPEQRWFRIRKWADAMLAHRTPKTEGEG